MFHHNAKLLLTLLTTFAFCSSTTTQAHTNCNRTCGQRSLQYPFGFSSGCQVKLNCSQDHTVKISHLDVQRVTSQSIFVTLPLNCNRSVESIYPLFGDNYAPTWNNSFHVHNCKSKLGGCVIPPRSFGGEAEGCDNTSGAVICVTQLQRNGSSGDFQTKPDWLRFGCKFVFSALAFAKITVNEVSIQFQTVELGWWLSGRCNASSCSANASCDSVHLAGGNLGFRCRCRDGFVGDGFANGKGCQKDGVPTQSNASTRCSHGYRKAVKIGLLVGGIILGAILLSALSLLCNFSRRRSSWLRKQLTVKRLLREAAGNSTVPLYPYKEIERATSFFSDKHRLGTGAFGTVYAGHLHNDEWVAIKKIKYRDTNSVDQVMNEIKLLSSVSHPNLVRLLGCCIEGGEQILVYEYMPNGTLSEHLQRERGGVLPWTRRLTIATETANAIAYLHSAIDPPIYHRDIKSSNILLDYNCQSKVADFGLSRLGMTEISHISTAPQGTPGYVDPQYHQNFHLSDKSDVYSFGVVLVEIITAMKVVDFGRPQSEINLAALAVDRIRRSCIDDIIDPFLEPHRDAWTLYSLHKVAELAFRCLAFHSDMRPTMIEVAEELELIRRSGWAAMEETLCTASSVGSVCSSPRNGSAVYLRGVSFERDAGHGNETLIVQHKTDSFLQSIEEVKDSSPVSVHGTWLSGTSSPSTNSLLGNVVQ